MIKSKSFIFSKNSSRVGNAIRLSSPTGTPSCFPGGRRMVKWTRSTELSDFSKLRQVRPPACGSPDTNKTRKRSRTPFIWISAVLFRSVSSVAMAGDVNWITLRPLCGNVTGSSKSWPSGTLKRCAGSPSIEISSGTFRTDWGAAPISSIRRVKTTGSPIIAKAGALRIVRRRSQSVALPDCSKCIGAGRLMGRSPS